MCASFGNTEDFRRMEHRIKKPPSKREAANVRLVAGRETLVQMAGIEPAISRL